MSAPKSVRQRARERGALDGADAQALEGALTVAERERDEAVASMNAQDAILTANYNEQLARANQAEHERNQARINYEDLLDRFLRIFAVPTVLKSERDEALRSYKNLQDRIRRVAADDADIEWRSRALAAGYKPPPRLEVGSGDDE